MAGQGTWQWQEAGTSWKGVGIYHLTLTIPSREPLLGTLVIPNNDPAQARVEQTELGQALLDSLRSVPMFHPEIQVLQYSLMPDHLHCIWYVRKPMAHCIRYVAQGFWRAAKKAVRAYTYLHSRLPGGTTDEMGMQEVREMRSLSFIASADSRENPLRQLLGDDVYSRLDPLFTEVPFIRPMSRRGQLQTMIHYVQQSPAFGYQAAHAWFFPCAGGNNDSRSHLFRCGQRGSAASGTLCTRSCAPRVVRRGGPRQQPATA